MANRATATDVKGIISTKMGNDRVNNFITSAHILIEEHLSGAGHTAQLMKQIEIWLAAHLLAVDERREVASGGGDVSFEYEKSKPGFGLSATMFGQQAMALDSSGILASLGSTQPGFIGRVSYDDNPGAT